MATNTTAPPWKTPVHRHEPFKAGGESDLRKQLRDQKKAYDALKSEHDLLQKKYAGAIAEVNRGITGKKDRKEHVLALLKQKGFDPFSEILEILQAEDCPLTPNQRLQACQDLATYIAPKRKAIEQKVESEQTINVRVQRFGDSKDVGASFTLRPESAQYSD